jgi:hypothetical protein
VINGVKFDKADRCFATGLAQFKVVDDTCNVDRAWVLHEVGTIFLIYFNTERSAISWDNAVTTFAIFTKTFDE